MCPISGAKGRGGGRLEGEGTWFSGVCAWKPLNSKRILNMGGCHNYGPFLDPYYNMAPFRVPNKGP